MALTGFGLTGNAVRVHIPVDFSRGRILEARGEHLRRRIRSDEPSVSEPLAAESAAILSITVWALILLECLGGAA